MENESGKIQLLVENETDKEDRTDRAFGEVTEHSGSKKALSCLEIFYLVKSEVILWVVHVLNHATEAHQRVCAQVV